MTFYLLMTAAQKMRCNGTWTHFLPAMSLDSPSAHRKRRSCFSPTQTITVKSQKLPTVDKFTYLGSALSRSVIIDDDDDAEARIVWERQGLNLQTKLNVYKAVVMTSHVLCACEIWTVYCRHARKLNRFHINCLHRLLRITWQDMIPDTEVLKCAGLQSIHALLKKAQLR